MEQFGAESQKSDYFPSDARLLRPQDPVVRRNVKFKVHHAVRQRGRHPVGNGLVLLARLPAAMILQPSGRRYPPIRLSSTSW